MVSTQCSTQSKHVAVGRLAALKAVQKINADSNEFAPSVEEANNILEFHGFVERELAAA